MRDSNSYDDNDNITSVLRNFGSRRTATPPPREGVHGRPSEARQGARLRTEEGAITGRALHVSVELGVH